MGVEMETNGEMEKSLHVDGDENGDAPIKETVDASHFPKDAVVDWGTERKIHSFYFVRLRPYDDPKVKHKIDIADKEIQKRTKSRLQIADELRAKRSERAELKSNVRALISDSQKYRAMMDEKRKEIGPLQQALGKLRNTANTGRSGLCSSEEELNEVIYSLNYRIQHESISLTEEKQILRDIKAFEGTREKVIANASLRAKIEESLGQKDAIQDQVKLMGVNLDGVKKEQQAVSSKINQLDEKVKAIDKEINALQEEMNAVSLKRDEAFDSIKALRTQRDEGNSLFYQSRTVMTQVKDLAAKKDIKALEELSNSEVEKFMSLWNNNKQFRDDYEKRLLQSLDSRMLCRDGRMRNPDEKPLIAEAPEMEPVKQAKKEAKEEVKPPKAAVTEKVEAAVVSKKEKAAPVVEEEEVKVEAAQKVVVDEAKLKEMKREEEMAKAKQAMERKKKLAERAAAKAAAKAQKEAEKKLKEREKKMKKKAPASGGESEAVEEAPPEEEEEKGVPEESDPAPPKPNVRTRDKAVRNRGRPKPDRLPKALFTKRKSPNYYMWAAPAAGALLLAALLLLYRYAF